MHTYTAKTLTSGFAQEDERETIGTYALLNAVAQKQKEDLAGRLPSTLQVGHQDDVLMYSFNDGILKSVW